MTRGECRQLELLIDRESHGWSEAERLRVERHLASCTSCGELLATSRFVRDTLREAQGGLSALQRERALKRAFAGAAAAEKRGVGGARRGWFPVAAGLSAAAALLLAWWSGGLQEPRAQRALREPPGAPVVSDRYVASEALAAAKDAGRAPAASAPVWIEARTKEQREFGHASVELAQSTRARFDEASSTLVLAAGRVEVDVEVSRGRPFRVTTQHFRVEVLGTRFTVTPRSVVVVRGHVQVFALDGRVLASDLAAGSTFTYRQPATTDDRDRAVGDREPAAADGGPAAPPAGEQVSARSWLSRAREALSRNDIAAALALVERAEASAPGRSERAEAGTLRAEAALLSKQAARAIELYVEVAEHYADLPAGENAAFAAAQLAGRSQPSRERALLERYLARHPAGRFADEAKRRLERLVAH